jgi:LuxR family maltose regulon positive regulatory protein
VSAAYYLLGACVSEIERAYYFNQTSQYFWVYGQAGFGKTTLLKQYFESYSGEKIWVDISSNNHETLLSEFIKHNDTSDTCIIIDDIHKFETKWIAAIFDMRPKNAQFIISSRSFYPDVQIDPAILSQFTVLDHKKLRFNFNHIQSLLTQPHSQILAKDVYALTLGWPMLVNLISQKLPSANNITHLLSLLNESPNSLVLYCEQYLIKPLSESQIALFIHLVLVEKLPKTLFSPLEQIIIDDFYDHELTGLTSIHENHWQLLPVLKHSCLVSLLRKRHTQVTKATHELAERFLQIDDIESAIKLMLQIGDKTQAIKFLNKMGGLLEWIQHGLPNLMLLKKLFSDKDAQQFEPVAWLSCMVNYKLGRVAESRKIINAHWSKPDKDQLTWTVADAIIKLHEGRLFEENDLKSLNHFSNENSHIGPFTKSLIHNLLTITYLQSGNNEKARYAIFQAKKFYQLLSNAKYGLTYIDVHLIHSLILSSEIKEAKTLINKTLAEVQTHFSQDKSIRLALNIVKTEANFLHGIMPAVRTLDQLIKKLKYNESWFDLYAILYPIATQVALQNKDYSYIPKWFAIANELLNENSMAYLAELLSLVAANLISKHPEFEKELAPFCIVIRPISELPWRLQLLSLEIDNLKIKKNQVLIKTLSKKAMEQNNVLFSIRLNILLERHHEQTFLPTKYIEELKQKQLIGLIWSNRDFIPNETVELILINNNRTQLFDMLKGKKANKKTDLSDKEQAVMALLYKNLRNKEIALALGVSEQTVKFHLKNIFRKLGVASRKQAQKIIL